MKALRDFTAILRTLTGDSLQRNLPIADFVQPVYAIDDLQEALPNRSIISVLISAIPGTAVGASSAVSIVPRFPCFITRALASANSQFALVPQAIAAAITPDVNPPGGVVSLPDQVAQPMVSVYPTLVGFRSPGAVGVPFLFDVLSTGTIGGGLGTTSLFTVANQEIILAGNPIYMPAKQQILFGAVALNTAVTLTLRLDFCANAMDLGTDGAGAPLLP